jgi:hypothetical protein
VHYISGQKAYYIRTTVLYKEKTKKQRNKKLGYSFLDYYAVAGGIIRFRRS